MSRPSQNAGKWFSDQKPSSREPSDTRSLCFSTVSARSLIALRRMASIDVMSFRHGSDFVLLEHLAVRHHDTFSGVFFSTFHGSGIISSFRRLVDVVGLKRIHRELHHSRHRVSAKSAVQPLSASRLFSCSKRSALCLFFSKRRLCLTALSVSMILGSLSLVSLQLFIRLRLCERTEHCSLACSLFSRPLYAGVPSLFVHFSTLCGLLLCLGGAQLSLDEVFPSSHLSSCSA